MTSVLGCGAMYDVVG